MESEADPDAVREVYERAIANIPPAEEKRLWRRYIYLWINYALYEELLAKVCSIFAAVGLRGCRSSLQKKLTRISSSSQSVFCYLRWIRAVLSISFHGKLVHLSSPYSPGFFFYPPPLPEHFLRFSWQFTSTHSDLYPWVKRSTTKLKFNAYERNTMKGRTQTSSSRV